MTCEERWLLIEPGVVVEFKDDGRHVVKLADQWDRYTGINGHCSVELGTGLIQHVSQYCDLHATYKDQFKIVFL